MKVFIKSFLLNQRLKDIFLLFLLGVIPQILYSGQTGKIAGRITDAENGEILMGVNISIDGYPLGAASDLEWDK